jgi:hypothetical protein
MNIVAFAAGTILIAACICPVVPTTPLDKSFETSWARCISILEYHTSQIQSSRRAIETLMALKQRIERSNVAASIGTGNWETFSFVA